ncbi:hypothetical protein [Nostoc sp.]
MGVLNADYSSTSRTEYLSCILTTGTFILFDNECPMPHAPCPMPNAQCPT